jgi:hypothetical protein
MYYADFPPSAHPPTGPRCLSPCQKLPSAPGPDIIDDRQNRETRYHEPIPSLPGNETRKRRKISVNQASSAPVSQSEPSSGSLELSRSGASLQRKPSSITLHTDPSTNLSVIRFAIQASRWLQQQIVEPAIGSPGDTISQGRGVCGQSIYTLLFDKDYCCFGCGDRQDKRIRAITHQRVHFGHRPFRCEGACGRKSWWVLYT